MIKRSLTAIIGLPLVIAIIVLGNKYIIDVVVALLAACGIYEYMRCAKNKFRVVSWIGYLLAIGIAFLHVIPNEYIINYLGLAILSIVAILFMHVVFSDMKINFVDIAMTLIGIVYIIGFFAFVALIYGYEKDGVSLGKYYVTFLFLATWGSDIFAYLIGCKIGKHRFSKISPNKSIEGCVAGAISGIVLPIIAAILFNVFLETGFEYWKVAVVATIVALLGQIGDFSASCIKRYCEVKDFSNLLPGHGGIIDRFDSVIFSAPFMYYLIKLLF